MNKTSKGNATVFVIVLVLLAVGISFYLYRPAEFNSLFQKHVLQQDSINTSDQSSPLQLRMVSSPGRNSMDGCFGSNIFVFSYWDRYKLAGYGKYQIVDSSIDCYEVGKSYKVYAREILQFDKIRHFLYYPFGEVTIQEKKPANFTKIDPEVLNDYVKSSQYDLKLTDKINKKAHAKVITASSALQELKSTFVSGAMVYKYKLNKIDYTNMRTFFQWYPELNTLAQPISLEEVKNLVNAKIIMLTTNPAIVKSVQEAYPNNLVLIYTPANARTVLENQKFDFGVDDHIDLSALPTDLNTKIVIMDPNLPASPYVFRTFLRLSSLGYKSLYWYGVSTTIQFPKRELAQKINLQTIDHNQVVSLVKDGAKMIYTPLIGRNNIRSKIKDSIFIKYILTKQYFDFPRVFEIGMGQFDFEHMKNAKEYFYLNQLPQNKNTKLIFYGRDKYDFVPYKAAVWAKRYGWENIYLYEGGYATWNTLRIIFGDSFAFEPQE